MIFHWFGGQKLLLEMSIESFRKSKWVFVAERQRSLEQWCLPGDKWKQFGLSQLWAWHGVATGIWF